MSSSGASSHTLRNFVVSNGLPWTPAIEISLSDYVFDSVEIINILTEKEWDALFVVEKKAKQQLALIAFHDIK